MKKMTIFFLISMSALAAKCHDGCSVEETKCEDGRSMICNSKQDWELVADCEGIEPAGELACCVDPSDGLASCLPVVVCESIGVDTETE